MRIDDNEADLILAQRESALHRRFQHDEIERKRVVYRIQSDLYDFAAGRGFTTTQRRNALNDLFNTFASEWSVYIFMGADGIVDAITNDVTLSWLDLDANGQTIRQRLINRLT